jgi:hypothetical protein
MNFIEWLEDNDDTLFYDCDIVKFVADAKQDICMYGIGDKTTWSKSKWIAYLKQMKADERYIIGFNKTWSLFEMFL